MGSFDTVDVIARAALGRLSLAIHRARPRWAALDGLRQVPHWCDRPTSPGIDEIEEWREWTGRSSTADQLRIETELERMPLGGKRILHVGVGNSGLAQRFANRLASIDGITIQAEEVAFGRAMAISNYRVLCQNKYAPLLSVQLGASYDYIVDNNPTTFACCLTHFLQMIDQYYAMLRVGGYILTDRMGLMATSSDNHLGWRIDGEVWRAVGHAFGLRYASLTDFIIALERPKSAPSHFMQIIRRLGTNEARREK